MKKTIYIGLISLLFLGCSKDYLETSPTDKVDDKAIFSSIENVETVINGVYRYMFERTTAVSSNQQNKPGVGGVLLSNDFLAEDLHIGSSSWFTGTGDGNWNGHRIDNGTNTAYVYRTFYRIIGNANAVLDNIDLLDAPDDQKARLKSQALVLRAYAYSYLVQYYGKRYDVANKPNSQPGVPLPLSQKDNKMPRVSVEEVYAAINKDLDDAIGLNVATRADKSQTNVWIAKGLKARVALTMQDYDNAIKYAREVINSQSFKLMTVAEYKTGFNNAGLSEFMWASMPSEDQGDTFGSYFAQIAYNANTSFQRANPKRINSVLYDFLPATDVRKTMWEPTPTQANFPLPASNFVRQPFMSRKFSIKAAGGTLGDVSLMRLSEMYLIEAESYASKGQSGPAQDVLHEINSVRNPSAVKSTKIGNELLKEIWNYRRVELWGEGFRFLDLKRLNQDMDRNTVPNYTSAAVGGFMLVKAGDDRWQFLIPRSEMENNPNIGEQNK
ncbi:RagB/SusD family nutrient uptake outer membrane protein [Sphingobacterium sp. xlx-130]|uniref:RagB/SusD family nutrient uptake outer membrane protein n=1 Tax=Sphingobacterium sp. xlx-130 TaxID=2654323 RepID=UPI0013DA1CAB|nr:RagB/SusD family nutrient uptake outer membrane protein [Sphingobacterium sp. xlx-130]